IARKHPPTRLHLIVEIGEPSETRERAEDIHDRVELPRIHFLAVAGDMPPAGENEARPRRGVVEHRLGRSRRIAVNPTVHQHDEHPVAARHRALSHVLPEFSGGSDNADLEPVLAHTGRLVPPYGLSSGDIPERWRSRAS